MPDLIKFKKGLKSKLPNLSLAEPAYVTDEERLYVGGVNGNVPFPSKQDIAQIEGKIGDTTQLSENDLVEAIKNDRASLAENVQQIVENTTQISNLENDKASKNEVNVLATEKANQIDLVAERARIDLLVAPPAGVDNAETADIRVGADATTFSSAGNAVRAIAKGYGLLKDSVNFANLDIVDCDIKSYTPYKKIVASGATYNSPTIYEETCNPGDIYNIKYNLLSVQNNAIGGVRLYFWNGDTVLTRNDAWFPNISMKFTAPYNTTKITIYASAKMADGSNVPVGSVLEFSNIVLYKGEVKIDESKIKIQSLETAKEDILNLKSYVPATLPSYYDAYLANKIATIQTNELTVGAYGDTLAFITDVHWDYNAQKSPLLLDEIRKKTTLRTIVCGGDIINQGERATELSIMRDCINAFKNKFGSNFKFTFGNHEQNTMGQTSATEKHFTVSEVYSMCMKHQENSDVVQGEPPLFYYYFDNKLQKIRYIVLDTGKYDELGQAQIDWLENVISNTEDGWSVAFFAHWMFTLSGETYVYGNAQTEFISNFVNAIAGKSSVTFWGKTYDFSTRNLEVPFVMCGHVHADYSIYTTNGVPIIATTTDRYLVERPDTLGTITEQAFDIVQIDKINKKVLCTRIGYGSDRVFNY